MLKAVVECLDVGQDSNGLETEAGHVKECKSRPMPKCKNPLILHSSSCDKFLSPKRS